METMTLPDHTDHTDHTDPTDPTDAVEPAIAVVSTAFEACVAFSAPGDGSPVCSACGWLAAEHRPAVGALRSLPRRRSPNGPAPAQRSPARRLAS